MDPADGRAPGRRFGSSTAQSPLAVAALASALALVVTLSGGRRMGVAARCHYQAQGRTRPPAAAGSSLSHRPTGCCHSIPQPRVNRLGSCTRSWTLGDEATGNRCRHCACSGTSESLPNVREGTCNGIPALAGGHSASAAAPRERRLSTLRGSQGASSWSSRADPAHDEEEANAGPDPKAVRLCVQENGLEISARPGTSGDHRPLSRRQGTHTNRTLPGGHLPAGYGRVILRRHPRHRARAVCCVLRGSKSTCKGVGVARPVVICAAGALSRLPSRPEPTIPCF